MLKSPNDVAWLLAPHACRVLSCAVARVLGIPNPNSLRVGSLAAAASPNPPATSSVNSQSETNESEASHVLQQGLKRRW